MRNELKRFNEIYVDVDKMINQAREADRVRSQMVILERRVQILHEEKAVLTSMERRLQERCAELQREIFRLQGAQNENSFKSIDKQAVSLPRHIPPGKQDSSEHEDEGISSSDTGPSLSPVPILVLPQNSNNMNQRVGGTDATIEDVMEVLDNVVNEAEKQISSSECKFSKLGMEAKEKEIIPVNIVPQPPRKSRSLAHLVHPDGSDMDGSEYGMLMMQKQMGQNQDERVAALKTFFDEADYIIQDKPYHRTHIDSPEIPEHNTNQHNAYHTPNNTTRELLDVIMNARHCEDDPTLKALRDGNDNNNNEDDLSHNEAVLNNQNKRHSFAEATNGTVPAQHFNGVFFMTGMNKPQKYPKPDLTAALQAKRVTKNVERLEAVFASHNETFNDAGRGQLMPSTREKSKSNQQIYFSSNPTIRIGSYTSQNSRPDLLNTNNVNSRTRSYTQGSKVTDIPSGLY